VGVVLQDGRAVEAAPTVMWMERRLMPRCGPMSCLAAGDVEGCAAWKNVVRAIRELLDTGAAARGFRDSLRPCLARGCLFAE
jgi:hypothetical protein